MHTGPDTCMTVDALERIPLNLLFLWIDLDSCGRTSPLTVLTLVTFFHIKDDLASGTWTYVQYWVGQLDALLYLGDTFSAAYTRINAVNDRRNVVLVVSS